MFSAISFGVLAGSAPSPARSSDPGTVSPGFDVTLIREQSESTFVPPVTRRSIAADSRMTGPTPR